MQKVLVLGLGSSGMAAARLLRKLKIPATVLDSAHSPALQQKADLLQEEGCQVLLNARHLPPEEFNLCVISPGLAVDAPLTQLVLQRGIPLISELAFGSQFLKTKILAITGSNGKSTLAKLCADTFSLAGFKVCLAGNYGLPVCQVVAEEQTYDWVVLEVSSFQLEFPGDFQPDIALLLNLYPNHLDRHYSLTNYRNLKLRFFRHLSQTDFGIVPFEFLATVTSIFPKPKWLSFGLDLSADYTLQTGRITQSDGSPLLDLTQTAFDNKILGITAAAATAAIQSAGVSLKYLNAALPLFKALPHRTELVRELRGVKFINDSKATNVAALLAALEMTRPPLRLIAGGQGKNESFAPALKLLGQKAAKIYLIGRDAAAMAEAWEKVVPCGLYLSLDQAVAAAWEEAEPGETILFSPACASFDQFRDFVARGESYKRLVTELR